MIAFRDANKNEKSSGKQSIASDYEIEEYLLQKIEDLNLRGHRITSRQDLANIIETSDGLDMNMWLLTLEGKGFIKMTEGGYCLTERAKKRLQKKT